MRTQSLLSLFFCAVALLVLYGCAELQEPPPEVVAPGIAVHPPGWTDTTSSNFHGQAIAANSWDMRGCRTCHGQTYAGGAVGVSCLPCHSKAGGPENCTTCHGSTNAAPPEDLSENTATTARGVGAHQIHLVGPRNLSSATITCSDCHHVPASVYEPGHVDSAPPAEVPISGALGRNPSGGITPTPTYDYTAGTCSNTFCHGAWRLPKAGADSRSLALFADSAMTGNAFAPVWNGGKSQAACGTCHGFRVTSTGDTTYVPNGHVVIIGLTACASCHAPVVDGSGRIADPSKHINGKVNVYGEEHNFR